MSRRWDGDDLWPREHPQPPQDIPSDYLTGRRESDPEVMLGLVLLVLFALAVVFVSAALTWWLA